MQIGNNRPNDRQPSHLDPDLTRANRDGIADTTRVTSEKTQKSIEDRSPAKAAEARSKPLDSFQRSKPDQDQGFDVKERIKNARDQAGQKRIANAREQHVKSTEGAPDKAQRIANARAQRADAQSQRAAQARKQSSGNDGGNKVQPDNGKRIESARGQHAERLERVENARTQHTEAAKGQRVENARTQHTEAAKSQRVENARTQYMKNSQVDSPRSVRITPTSVELPGRSGELPGISGKPESSGARAVRIEGLRQAHQAGELNTPERASEAAGRLLGGA